MHVFNNFFYEIFKSHILLGSPLGERCKPGEGEGSEAQPQQGLGDCLSCSCEIESLISGAAYLPWT